jgi:hypothetical protein
LELFSTLQQQQQQPQSNDTPGHQSAVETIRPMSPRLPPLPHELLARAGGSQPSLPRPGTFHGLEPLSEAPPLQRRARPQPAPLSQHPAMPSLPPASSQYASPACADAASASLALPAGMAARSQGPHSAGMWARPAWGSWLATDIGRRSSPVAGVDGHRPPVGHPLSAAALLPQLGNAPPPDAVLAANATTPTSHPQLVSSTQSGGARLHMGGGLLHAAAGPAAYRCGAQHAVTPPPPLETRQQRVCFLSELGAPGHPPPLRPPVGAAATAAQLIAPSQDAAVERLGAAAPA